ncbi:hypothetical protein Bca4012_078626 [Brassica carinata]
MLSLEKQRPKSSSSEEAQAVISWVVSGNVDHEKVIEKFGCDRIDESLIARVERLTASAGAAYYLSSSKKRRAYSKTKIAPLWGVWIQRKLFSEREDVSGLLMASKICGERSGLAEEGIDYARISLGNECVQLDGAARLVLGIALTESSRASATETERVARLSEGMQALESADITDPRVLHRLALENTGERKLDSALAYAKHALKLGAESDLETIVDAALNETGKWKQGKLLRLKAKFRVAKGEVKDAIVTYTQLLALLQVQSKSLSSAKKMPKGYDVEGLRSLELGTWHDLALIYINLSQWRDAETCLSRSKKLLTLTWILILVFENDGNILQTRCIRKEGCLIISGRCVLETILLLRDQRFCNFL